MKVVILYYEILIQIRVSFNQNHQKTSSK